MRGKKYIVPLLLAGATASGYVANIEQSVSVSAEESVMNTVEVSIEGGFKDSSDNTQTSFGLGNVYLPVVKVNGVPDSDYSKLGVTYDFNIKRGSDKIEYVKDANKNNAPYFNAQYEGYYTVTIVTLKEVDVPNPNGEGTIKDYQEDKVIDKLSVLVTKGDAVINLPVNSKYVIPAKMPVGQTNLKIPAPTVTIGDDEEETKANELQSKENKLVVKLVRPVASSEEKDDSVVELKLDETNSFYAVDPELLQTTGTYQIVYEYSENDAIISRLESNFAVVKNYKPEDIKLTMSILDSIPTSGNINTDVSIPKIRVTDSASSLNSINCHITIIVKNLKTGTTFDVDYEKYTFKPTEIGFYTVTYKADIQELFGISTMEVTPDQTIEIKDKEKPVLRPTYAYSYDDSGKITTVNGVNVDSLVTEDKTREDVLEELLENRKTDVPSVAILKDVDGKKVANVTIPAVYATDNYDKFNEIKYTRSYRTSGGTVTTINTPFNEVATIPFETTGKHEIRYKAVDRAGNTLGEVVYDIVVYDDTEENKTKLKTDAKLDFVIGNKTVSDKDEVITFKKPVVNDSYDTSIEVLTYYQLKNDGTDVGELVKLTDEDINKDGKYEIKLKELLEEKNNSFNQVQVVVKAKFDEVIRDLRALPLDDNSDLFTFNGHGYDIPVIDILNSKLDTKAPVVTTADWESKLFELNSSVIANTKSLKDASDEVIGGTIKSISADGWACTDEDGQVKLEESLDATTKVKVAPFDQGTNIITLPEVKFGEEYDANLKISVTITDNDGNKVSKYVGEQVSLSGSAGAYVYSVSGMQLKLSKAGLYTVTYRAEDIGGNITIKNYGIRVNDRTAPSIVIEDEKLFGGEVEVGESFTIPTAYLVKNGQKIEGKEVTTSIIGLSGAEYDTKGLNSIIPTTEGTFMVVYSVKGTGIKVEDESLTFTAKATKTPTIILNNSVYLPGAMEFNKEENKSFMKIKFPSATATDNQINASAEVTYSVSGPNGSKPTVHNGDDIGMKYFEATVEGQYTITYKAVSKFGVESTVTKTLALGDCENPTLEWKKEDIVTEVKLNEEFKLDLSKLNLDDNKTSVEDLADKLTVTLTSPSSQTVTNNGSESSYKWNMTETGNYTLKFVLKDNAGNTNTYTYSINVPEEEVEEETMSPVLGTVLVVLSVVVLAGVVIYFVASSRKKGGKVTRPTKKNK